MAYPRDDEARTADKRKLCTMMSWGLIGLALIVLFIVIVTRAAGSKQPVKRGGGSGADTWKAGGGSCGCMAGM
jgi:hypothetical protein